jgi:hypothetical protein
MQMPRSVTPRQPACPHEAGRLRTRALGAALAASSLVLAGCLGPGIYDKPGVTYEEWKHDDAECRREAGDGAPGGLDRDAHDRCMRARGYRVPVIR